MKILDIGTGAGFFAILLAQLGHKVTGIDMSADMLHQAKQNVLAAGCSAEFRKMNAQELDFADETFDVVISRNLTWTLPDVMQAYREWQRVLKKGGKLLNFDSDYGLVTFSRKEDQADVHANIRQELVTECNDIKDELRISTHRRPQWDAQFLRDLGMQVKRRTAYQHPSPSAVGCPVPARFGHAGNGRRRNRSQSPHGQEYAV